LRRRRQRSEWVRAAHDRRKRDGLPFTFFQSEQLAALGVAFLRDDVAVLDRDLLRVWRPRAGSTNEFVLAAGIGRFVRNPSGTRIDPLAAAGLRDARAELEVAGAVTSFAWCTHCGRLFVDRRVSRGWHVTRIAQWCERCRKGTRTHKLKWRKCEGPGCDRWFQPTRANQIFHSEACSKAAQRASGRAQA
jgi:hypothetical protein